MTEACCPRPNAPPVLAPHGYPVEADGSVEARSVDGQRQTEEVHLITKFRQKIAEPVRFQLRENHQKSSNGTLLK